jgi:DAACS family dicarboxylate/amino acid:cation (Na+ or H+) symporter
MVAVVALLTSVGVAGVPSASLVAIAVILEAVQAQLPPGALPEGASLAAGMALLMVFDRPLDMLRTAVNVFGDSVGAVVVARLQGEEGVLER